MKLQTRKNINVKALTFNSLMFLLIVYFIYHSISGERGMLAYVKLKKQLVVRTEILDNLKVERKKLDASVKLINPKTADKDMIDELARRELGLIGKDEVMLILN